MLPAASTMRPVNFLPTRRQLVGLWLAVLAVFALNLQALAHYEPQMLDGSICSATAKDSGVSGSQGNADHVNAGCAVCCAQAQVPTVGSGHPVPVRTAAVAPQVVRPVAEARSWPWWPTSRPRGPPAIG